MENKQKRLFENRVALITGSTSGIGLAIAKTLASEGCNIAMTGSRPLEKVEDLRTNIEQTYNVKVIYLQADLNETDKAKWIVDETAKHFERLDILVNNAGIGDIHPIEDFPDETFEKILRVNFLSNWYTCKHAIPHMKRNNWGRIINISSLAGRNGFTNHSPYVSSKHAQIGLTKALALELAQTNITVNAILPGVVDTAAWSSTGSDEFSKLLNCKQAELVQTAAASMHPSKKVISPEEIAETAKFLCSEGAREIRGAEILHDAGANAQ